MRAIVSVFPVLFVNPSVTRHVPTWFPNGTSSDIPIGKNLVPNHTATSIPRSLQLHASRLDSKSMDKNAVQAPPLTGSGDGGYVPSKQDLIKQLGENVGGDGSIFSQLAGNPFFTAVGFRDTTIRNEFGDLTTTRVSVSQRLEQQSASDRKVSLELLNSFATVC